MNFLEKNLEQIIYETDNEKLRDRGLFIDGFKARQVRIGNYGIADLVTFDKGVDCDGHRRAVIVKVFELKKDKIDTTTLLQSVRYIKGIKSYLTKRNPRYAFADFDITLVGKEVCKSDFVYVSDIFPNISLYEYSYDFEGIKFNRVCNYTLREEGFKNGETIS